MLQWWDTDSLLKPKEVEDMSLDQGDSSWNENASLGSKKETQLREWVFCVRVNDLSPGDIVCVTGSAVSLGCWDQKEMLVLKIDNNEENRWIGVAEIPINEIVEYRYCTAIVLDSDLSKTATSQYVIRKWESFTPRIINICDKSSGEVDTFGYFKGKEYSLSKGWLTSTSILQLKLFDNPIHFWKTKLQDRKINIKVTPVNLTKAKDNNYPSVPDDTLSLETFEEKTSTSWPITEIAILNEQNRGYKQQDQFGTVFNNEEFMVFQIHMVSPETVAYLLDFYTYMGHNMTEDLPYHIGFSCILPSVLKGSEGQVVIPITSIKQKPIGQITVEYLLINPIADYTCSLQGSMKTDWKESWKGLDVGHRGVGSSFAPEKHKCADVRENTIASLKSAASHGADFVEFDVQLSRDLVPVLYHDFHVCISMKKKKYPDDNNEMLQLPLKELTLEQLHLLKLYHVQEGRNKNSSFFDEDLEEHQPFPKLQQALEVLDPSVGFNVELKWTMKREDGSLELSHPFDLNLFVDKILKVVLDYAGPRRIVFSCFHPDICTMIQLKQNKYPVMFLTQCITPKYPIYYDPRCQTIPMAVHFAVNSNILGINVHTEELLRDVSQIKLIKDANLVLFCWGEDNNNSETIKRLKNMGLHGIIYDKIDKFSCKDVKESIFRLEARESQQLMFHEVAERAEREANAIDDKLNPTTSCTEKPEPGFKNYLLDMDKVHDVSTRLTSSTCSALTYRSVDQFGTIVPSSSKLVATDDPIMKTTS